MYLDRTRRKTAIVIGDIKGYLLACLQCLILTMTDRSVCLAGNRTMRLLFREA